LQVREMTAGHRPAEAANAARAQTISADWRASAWREAKRPEAAPGV
jgi:hypothetical protein